MFRLYDVENEKQVKIEGDEGLSVDDVRRVLDAANETDEFEIQYDSGRFFQGRRKWIRNFVDANTHPTGPMYTLQNLTTGKYFMTRQGKEMTLNKTVAASRSVDLDDPDEYELKLAATGESLARGTMDAVRQYFYLQSLSEQDRDRELYGIRRD